VLKGASMDGIKKGVSTFQGIQRRFDIILDTKEMVYIDDYAHHPVEISTLLNSVKKLLPNYPIIAIFQPHLYSRTKDFANQFAESLSIANIVIMLPIYPARENPIPGITSQMIYEQIQCKHKYLISMEEIVDKLPQFITKPSVILTIGAGDIDKIVEPLKNKLISIQ
jgi:UDP-N-acetylmuramate--alanine ligase